MITGFVRHKAGVPVAADFGSADGGPLIINTVTGDVYALTDAGAVVRLNPVVDINGQTQDTTPDGANDFLLTYDTSAATNKKILLNKTTAFKVGIFTRDMTLASGSQSITGVGFKPKLITCTSSLGAGTVYASADGISDGIANSCMELYGAGGFYIQGFFLIMHTTPADYQSAIVASLDADGFTLTWTKSGTPTGTGTIIFAAYR